MIEIKMFSLLQIINYWNLSSYRTNELIDLLITTDCQGYSPSSTPNGLLLYQYFSDGSYTRYFI